MEAVVVFLTPKTEEGVEPVDLFVGELALVVVVVVEDFLVGEEDGDLVTDVGFFTPKLEDGVVVVLVLVGETDLVTVLETVGWLDTVVVVLVVAVVDELELPSFAIKFLIAVSNSFWLNPSRRFDSFPWWKSLNVGKQLIRSLEVIE